MKTWLPLIILAPYSSSLTAFENAFESCKNKIIPPVSRQNSGNSFYVFLSNSQRNDNVHCVHIGTLVSKHHFSVKTFNICHFLLDQFFKVLFAVGMTAKMPLENYVHLDLDLRLYFVSNSL